MLEASEIVLENIRKRKMSKFWQQNHSCIFNVWSPPQAQQLLCQRIKMVSVQETRPICIPRSKHTAKTDSFLHLE